MVMNWLRRISQSIRQANRPAVRGSNVGRSQLVRFEDRITPTVTSSLVGSTATLVSDAAADAINITQAAGFLLLNGSFDWDTASLGIQFLAAASSSTINLSTGAGADTINVGDTGASPASLNLARINYNSGGAGDQLHVFDNGNGSSNTYIYNTSTFTATGIDLNIGGTSVTGGRFLVTGLAADTIHVQSVFGGEPCTVDSAAGNDTVTVGTAGGGMGSINDQVEIQNNTIADFTVVILEDGADTTADTVSVTNGALVSVAGLADGGGKIVYDPVDVQIVTINAGSGGNTFNFDSISENVNLNAGSGSNLLNLNAAGSTGSLKATGPGAGLWDWDSFGNINYTGLDSISTDGTVNIPLTASGSSSSEFLRLSRVNAGTNLRVSESGQTWILIPYAQLAGTIQVDGNLGNDRLEVDHGTDTIIDQVINYNGGGGTDELLMNGNLSGSSSGVYNPGAADPDGFSGQIIHTDSTAKTCTVNFTGLSPVEDLTVLATYTINGFTGADKINIVNGPLSGGADPITGLQESTIEVNFNGAAELVRFRNKPTVTVDAKAGADTVDVNVTTTGTGLTSLNVDTNDGNDSVTLRATDLSFNTTITSSKSAGGVVLTDTVTIGNNGSVQGILGPVSVNNPPALTDLVIDDSADSTGRVATLDSGSIVGLAPSKISWSPSDLNALTINGGSSGNTFLVTNTPSSIFSSLKTTLNSGIGADTVNVQATAGTNGASLEIEGQSGNDDVNIGSNAPILGGTLGNIAGGVRIRNTGSFTDVNIDDSGDVTARTAIIDTTTVGAQIFGRVTGLGNAGAIEYAIGNTLDVTDVTVRGGSGGNTFNVDQSAATASFTLKLELGAGSDTANITPDNLVTFQVNGGNPTPPTTPGDTLNVDLTGSTNPALTTSSTAAGLSGGYSFSDRKNINFQEIESLSPAGADLSIEISDGAASAIPGNKVTYTITVTNNGPLDVTGANVTDLLPSALSGVTFTAVQSGGATGFTASGSNAINDIVNMPIGSTITYTVTGTINSSATGNLVTKASVTSPVGNVDPVPGNNDAQDSNVLTPLADLGVIQVTDTPDPVFLGNNITYTFVVRNAGPSDAQNAGFSGNIPANTTFVSLNAPAGWNVNTPANGGTGPITGSIASLSNAAGDQVFTLVVRVNTNTPAGSQISNKVGVSTTTADLNPANDQLGASTLVSARAVPLVVGADAGGGPHVIVYDSATGNIQFSFFAYDASFKGGVRVATGDVSGDGVADILTAAGAGGGPHVKVFDGVTGKEIRSFFAYDAGFIGGVFIAAGDVNGDGFADIITGADAGGGPHVKVISGSNGAVLQSFFAYGPSFAGGVRVASGDIDGDNRSDIVTGAGPGGGPHVQVFSGATGASIRSFFAFNPNFAGGVYVSSGDFNNDSKDDIITSSGPGNAPNVVVRDSASLAVLASFNAYSPNFTGGVRVGVADVNGDGTLELVTGAGPGGGPHVQAFNVANQTPIKSFFAYDPSFMGGVFVG